MQILDELHRSLLGELGPYWAIKIAIMAVALIVGVWYCRRVIAWTSDLERQRAEYNEREREKLNG